MRFAYIDSNGNEVPIPSVDALALRIELGAIIDDTQLYDAAADQWAPANSHEIYHTLRRLAVDDEGFVAPPPVAAAPVVATPEPAVEDDPVAVEQTPEPVEPESEFKPVTALEEDLGDTQGLTLAEAPSEVHGGSFPDLDLDLDPAETEDLTLPAGDESLEGVGDLGFGGMDLDLGGDFGPGGGEPVPDFSGGMEFETSMEFGGEGGFDTGSDGGLDLEAPMSDFSPDEPPSWMEGEDTKDGRVLDFSSSAPAEEDREQSGRDRRSVKNKPSRPKHRKRRNLAGPLVGGVGLLAFSVGGYAAWPVISERLAALGEPDTPDVMIPDLAPELMTEMQSAADAAMAASFSSIVSSWDAQTRVDAPGTDWPGGSYMANASQYGMVEDFWNDMSDLLGAARDISLADFDAALFAELSAQGISGADALAIRERADSGYVAAAPARRAMWDRFAAAVDASLAMHQFAVANEDGIGFVPASTATTNPVLEIDAVTPEISAALDDMLGAVVDALADLGYRQLVSSEGLRRHLLTELQGSGIQ